jgi:hypothetical protein
MSIISYVLCLFLIRMSVRMDCCSGEFFFVVWCDLRLSVLARVRISVVLWFFFNYVGLQYLLEMECLWLQIYVQMREKQTGRREQKNWPVYSKQLLNVSLKGGVFLYHGLLKFYNLRISLSALLLFLEIPSWISSGRLLVWLIFFAAFFLDPVLKYMDNRSPFWYLVFRCSHMT